ncbi:hypothetical protein MMC12_005948 [Toensbergia leucococca]|nr:hypothetical protein [Toensbergia leucococca]
MSGVEAVVGVVLAIPSIIDLCIKYGKLLERKISLFMKAEERSPLQLFVLHLVAGGLNDMLLYFKEESRLLTLSFATELTDLTRQLNVVLLKAIEAFPSDSVAEEKGKISRLRFGLFEARRIDEASEELELWHSRFKLRADIYVTYVLRPKTDRGQIAASSSDSKVEEVTAMQSRLERLRQGRRLVTGPLLLDTSEAKLRQLPNSSVWTLEHPSIASDPLLEYRSYKGCSQDEVHATRLIVRKIAQKLREVEPTQGILPCLGFSEDPINDRFALHFSPPPNSTNPQSLRTLLADPRNRDKTIGKQHSITNRVHLAQAIAAAVGYVHSSEFVHKNIRPENIIIFEPQLSDISAKELAQQRFPFKIGEPYLVGYDGARNEDAETRLLDVAQWQRRLYLSPDRQDVKNTLVKYSMKHDIYSLGVVLLEIALWEDFTDGAGTYGKLFKAAKDPLKLLMQLTRRVPLLLGDKYRDAVVACLTELKEQIEDHQLDDADGIVVGMAFIAQVIEKLEKISV